MQNNPRILLACPIHVSKEYCLKAWLQHIALLDYPGLDVLLIDNSPEPIEIENKSIFYRHFPNSLKKPANQHMADCNNIIRDCMLRNTEYEYHFSLECDIFPDYHIIQRLMAHADIHNAPVVAAPYFINFGAKSQLMVQNIRQIGFHKNQMNELPIASFMECKPNPRSVSAAGLGCVLIHRSVYEMGISYHTGGTTDIHADSFFNYDLHRAGISVLLDNTAFCEHLNKDYTIQNH